ncbi:hypothetical protein AN958_07944 [Leucoagaricus sp. SymC.cos]|nr:hypothetical protein AN958_07944 [Leucoagaricus sp. SymC.cos]
MASSDVSLCKSFTFPLSPPNSGTVTAVSSPHLQNVAPEPPDAINHHFTFSSTRQNMTIHLPCKKLQKPPVVPDVLNAGEPGIIDSSLLPNCRTNYKSPARSLTLPTESSPLSIMTPAFPLAAFSRTDSTASFFSSSSTSIIHMRETPHTPGTGMGRKVAAKLQLFKESVGSTEDSLSAEPSRSQSSGSRRIGSSQIGDDEEIAEAQFKFVKRSEWPDREAAAIRRERSMTTLERVKDGKLGRTEGQEQDHSRYREGLLQEYNRWRKGFVECSEARRGRRRDRVAVEADDKGEQHTILTASRCETNTSRQGSHTFPPSPSPSRSPRRLSTSSQQSQQLASSESPSHHSSWPRVTRRGRGRRSRSPVLLHRTSEDNDHQSHHNSFVFKESDSNHSLHFDLSQECLPHIPLRPFRNQVGGHSSIYKFTKQAVCKPLVSRENLFYEAVEREAPPLLGFIPRYLGVMLVSYRRVPKSQVTSNVLSRTPTATSTSSVKGTPSTAEATSIIHASKQTSVLPAHGFHEETDTDETELPEVVLACNRHIIPEWMLKDNRNRSLSQSHINGTSVFAQRQLHRSKTHHGTASTPDLATTPTPQPVRFKKVSLNEYSSFGSQEMDAPTPLNSPSQALRAFPARLAERPHTIPRGTASDDDADVSRPFLRQFRSEHTFPGSPWGTGSTVVNTKLKDYVFQHAMHSAFRRVKRLAGYARSSQTEDEGEFAQSESGGSRRRSRKPRSFFGITKSHSDGCRTPVRRIQSEVMLAESDHVDAPNETQHNNSGNISGVFEMDLDPELEVTDYAASWKGANISPLLPGSRSHSRSFNSGPMYQTPSHSPPHPDYTPIPAQNKSDPSFTRQNHFILMEDLTGRLKHPCVMDLKMGTRQYGMDATILKKKSQRKKCDRTTSRTLGVRVCGMQVWNVAAQSYSIQDKYSGREVRPDEFDSVLTSFLSNGELLLVHQIPVLLQKLYALARIVNRLKGYRFYGCSLLLIYDGDRDSQEVFRSWALEHPSSKSKRGESLERRSRSRLEAEKATLRRSHSEDLLAGPVAKRSTGKRKRGEVNVRIVDFAHTTTGRDWLSYPGEPPSARTQDTSGSKGYQAEYDPETGFLYARFPPHYPDQPDRGFLFGLKNVTASLERLWNEERIRRVKAARDDPSRTENQLPPLPAEGREIFAEIFGDEEDGMISS